MTQEQIDQLISDWQHRIVVASENLLALDDTRAMKRIEGRDGLRPQPLTGVTAARVVPALETMRELFTQISTLGDMVERAGLMRRSLHRLWRYRETLAEIESLLTGPSIPLPELRTPLAERNLTSVSANARSITPERLLMAMTDAFATARDAVLSMETAWERWEPILDVLKSKETTLWEQVNALGLAVPVELTEASHRIEQLQRYVFSDPLGITGTEEPITMLLSTAHTKMEESRCEREKVTTGLLAAHRLFSEIVEQQARVARLITACEEVLEDAEGLHKGNEEASLRQLEEWLLSLELTTDEKRWQAALVGLTRWFQTAHLLQATLTGAEKTNASLLDLPAELRGRYAVLLARRRVMKNTDDTLGTLLLQLQSLLGSPRLPADRTIKLMEVCEERLRRASRGEVGK